MYIYGEVTLTNGNKNIRFGLGLMKRSKVVVALPTIENGRGPSQGLEVGLHLIGERKQGTKTQCPSQCLQFNLQD